MNPPDYRTPATLTEKLIFSAVVLLCAFMLALMCAVSTGCTHSNPLTVAPDLTAEPAQPSLWALRNILAVYDFTGPDEAGNNWTATKPTTGKENGYLVTPAFVSDYQAMLPVYGKLLGHPLPNPVAGIAPVGENFWVSQQVDADRAKLNALRNSPQISQP